MARVTSPSLGLRDILPSLPFPAKANTVLYCTVSAARRTSTLASLGQPGNLTVSARCWVLQPERWSLRARRQNLVDDVLWEDRDTQHGAVFTAAVCTGLLSRHQFLTARCMQVFVTPAQCGGRMGTSNTGGSSWCSGQSSRRTPNAGGRQGQAAAVRRTLKVLLGLSRQAVFGALEPHGRRESCDEGVGTEG